MHLVLPVRVSLSVAALIICAMQGERSLAGEVGPARLIEALRAQPDASYDFVVSFVEESNPDPAISESGDLLPLGLLHGFALKLKVAEAFELAGRKDVQWVWYLNPDEAPGTLRALQGIDYTLQQLKPPNLINLSIGPPRSFYRSEPENDAPIPRALKGAADRGFISIVAIGNEGERAPGYINPWSTSPWVIAVGAWDHTTGKVWSGSSTAKPEETDAWPDVVAPGVDVIGPWITTRAKTPEQKAYDEANQRFRENVAKQDWDKYTLMTGSSQAAAVVSGAAAQVLRYLLGFIEEHGKRPGDPMFELEAGADRISSHDRIAKRLTGTATPSASGGMTYAYTLDVPWKLVKQILMDTAIPVEGAEPWQAGAGLVDPDYIRAQFGTYGIAKPGILPVKVR